MSRCGQDVLSPLFLPFYLGTIVGKFGHFFMSAVSLNRNVRLLENLTDYRQVMVVVVLQWGKGAEMYYFLNFL